MKSIKKCLILILVAVLMATSFAACGRTERTTDSGEEVSSTPSEEPSAVSVEDTATPEASVEPSEEATTPEATPADENTAGETQADADAVLGSMDGNTYTNDYFGFSLDLPDGWYVASREELGQIMSMTADYLKSNTDTTIDLTQQTLVPLIFTASTNPFENTTGDTNPNIVCLAQNIGAAKSMIPDVKSFLNLAVQQVAATGVKMDFGEPEALTVDGQEIGKISGTTTINDIETTQTMYVILKGDYVIDFTLSSYSPEEKAVLEDAIGTIRFK